MVECYLYKGRQVEVRTVQAYASPPAWNVTIFIDGKSYLPQDAGPFPTKYHASNMDAAVYGKSAAEHHIDAGKGLVGFPKSIF
jgi:hypothetical protein